MSKYGGPWQEFRALIATALINLAYTVHAKCTQDIARDLYIVEHSSGTLYTDIRRSSDHAAGV